MTDRYKGVIVAPDIRTGHNALQRFMGFFDGSGSTRDYLIITPHSVNRGRGCDLPNRVLVYDLDENQIPEELWTSLLLATTRLRQSGEPLNVHYVRFVQESPISAPLARGAR